MKDSSRVVVILDRSGSMDNVKADTIGGFNEFIKQQKAVSGECTVKLVQFDTVYEDVFDKPLTEVPVMDDKMFVPRGGTALHDAMGRTIVQLGKDLKEMSEHDRPEHIIVVTITDGEENSSREYNQAQVHELVTHQQDVYKWQFIFVGANHDAVLAAQGIGIATAGAMNYVGTKSGIGATYAAVSDNVTAARSGRAVSFTKSQREKANK